MKQLILCSALLLTSLCTKTAQKNCGLKIRNKSGTTFVLYFVNIAQQQDHTILHPRETVEIYTLPFTQAPSQSLFLTNKTSGKQEHMMITAQYPRKPIVIKDTVMVSYRNEHDQPLTVFSSADSETESNSSFSED